MENDKLLISHAPHIWGGFSTGKIMSIVVFALLFPTGAAIYFFGFYAIYLILTSIASAVLSEFVIKKLRKKRFIMDGSAVVTGLLFALTLPPRLPLWMVVIGAFFAIAVVKEAFGGLGYNIFNPALAGRAFLSVCFPNEMTSWVLPPHFNYDAITGATPLSDNFVYHADKLSLYKDLFFGNRGGSLGETSVLLILIGAVILLILRIIDWKIPVIYIGIVALGSFLMGKDVLFQVMAGGLMIGAFFMATDYVTSPVNTNGRIIFAVGLGILTVLMRNFSNMPEGVCFSILIMNAFVPLLDKYVRIKPFGFIRKKKNA
jgi:electron transport complex protein RnfD